MARAVGMFGSGQLRIDSLRVGGCHARRAGEALARERDGMDFRVRASSLYGLTLP